MAVTSRMSMSEQTRQLDRSGEMSKWQPIETAPTDGTPILLWPFTYITIWTGRSAGKVVLGFYDYMEEEWFNPEERQTFEPTHWMSLPKPPEDPT